jgi:hypothetical protein
VGDEGPGQLPTVATMSTLLTRVVEGAFAEVRYSRIRGCPVMRSAPSGVTPFGPDSMHLWIHFRVGSLADGRGGCMLGKPLASG